MNRGILLIAYGKTYGKFAYNLAASLKAKSKVNIHLVCDQEAMSSINNFFPVPLFDSVSEHEFPEVNGRIDPCQVKIDLYNISPFDQTLYLDVDAVCMNDINETFEKLSGSDIYFQVMGKGGKNDVINYTHWCDIATIWSHFKLTDQSVFPSSQTSVIYFEKGKKAKEFFSKLQKNYKNRLDKSQYKNMWGLSKAHPDELYYSATAAQLGIIPNEEIQPLFYPNVYVQESKILKDYPILSVYGGHRTIKNYSLDLYDRIMGNVMKGFGLTHVYKAHNLYKLKFVTQR